MTLSISMKSQTINIANHAGGNYAKYSFDAIRGKSPELKAQIDLARRTARTASRVLLTGELSLIHICAVTGEVAGDGGPYGSAPYDDDFRVFVFVHRSFLWPFSGGRLAGRFPARRGEMCIRDSR